MKLVECVPNFSEGRDRSIIDQIAREVEETDGVKLLDVDPGADTNRTVVTFIGAPELVKEAAFKCIQKAAQLIDMRKHSGAHARHGATDVCPFVPVCGVTMEDCVQIAKEVGERVGRELEIPIYLYENAATRPERVNLAEVRKGEYEALEEKLKKPEWKPDFGPAIFNAKAGATNISAREFLIAYNINLNTKDAKLAKKVAFGLREQGRIKRNDQGKFVRDEQGNPVYEPGKFKGVKATGWYIDEYGQAQITMNITNYKVAPFHEIYEEARKDAATLGLTVTGSELVGLLPKEPMLLAADYYLAKQGKHSGIPEKDRIHIAIKSMGLEDISPFDPRKKIIEYAFQNDDGKLVGMNLRNFTDELSSDSPAPGGGSVAALAGAQAAGLVAMVGNLSHGKKAYQASWDDLAKASERAQTLKDQFLSAIDEDTDAFNGVMACFRLPKNTEEEKVARDEAIQEATKEATRVPLRVLKMLPEVLDLAALMAKKGNENSLSDAGVAMSMSRSAAEGAYMNVLINLKDINDMEFVQSTKAEAEATLLQVRETTDRDLDPLLKALKS